MSKHPTEVECRHFRVGCWAGCWVLPGGHAQPCPQLLPAQGDVQIVTPSPGAWLILPRKRGQSRGWVQGADPECGQQLLLRTGLAWRLFFGAGVWYRKRDRALGPDSADRIWLCRFTPGVLQFPWFPWVCGSVNGGDCTPYACCRIWRGGGCLRECTLMGHRCEQSFLWAAAPGAILHAVCWLFSVLRNDHGSLQ